MKDVYGDRKVYIMAMDLTNQRFSHLVVLGPVDDYVTSNGTKIKAKMWKCQCDCGAIVVTRGTSLVSGHTKGCGQKHRRYEDLSGKKFGRLTVLKQGEDEITSRGDRQIRWICQCDCGRQTLTRGIALRSGGTQSCGFCTRSESNIGYHLEDIKGQKFGRWTVIDKAGRYRYHNGKYVTLWRCKCECGEERNIRAGTLKRGLSLSCGCYKYESLAIQAKKGTRNSKLEAIVNQYLTSHDLYFEAQRIYPDLRGESGYPLSYDFLVHMKGRAFAHIECQGKQHYEPVEYFGGETQFKIQQHNDELKRQYSEKMGVKHIEIPYTMKSDDIIQLLNSVFDTKGSV